MDATIGLVRALLPVTLALQVQIPPDHPSTVVLGDERMGSGVMVGPGIALTVNYVVMGGRSIQATFVDGDTGPAEILAQDFETGLAVLRVPRRAGPSAMLGDSRSLARGREVFIVGSTGPTERRVSNGVVTGLGPFDAYWEYLLESAIQTSAINPGFGGGPLFDSRGRLLGIASLNLGRVGRFSLAIPIHYFSDHGEELVRFGRVQGRDPRAWIGVYAEPADAGLTVVGLVPNGPADRAGVREGDLIEAVDGVAVDTREAMYRRLWRQTAGAAVHLRIRRDEDSFALDVQSVDRAEFYR